MSRTCNLDGCLKPHYCRGWCRTHYQRWQRHGDPMMVKSSAMPGERNGRWKSVPGSLAAHLRVRSARGAASNYPCIDCGAPAREWSYNHNDPSELINEKGQPYSLNVGCYVPRCISCHRLLDSFRAQMRRSVSA